MQGKHQCTFQKKKLQKCASELTLPILKLESFMGIMEGVEGELYKEQRRGHLLTWGLKSGAKQQALCILSPEP
jgi:hypothetical protein